MKLCILKNNIFLINEFKLKTFFIATHVPNSTYYVILLELILRMNSLNANKR